MFYFVNYLENNNDSNEKSVRLKIIDMDDIDEDPEPSKLQSTSDLDNPPSTTTTTTRKLIEEL